MIFQLFGTEYSYQIQMFFKQSVWRIDMSQTGVTTSLVVDADLTSLLDYFL